MRKFFGGLFGLVSVICLGVSILVCSGAIIQGTMLRLSSRGALATLIVFCVFVSMAFVYAMACWTTWKAKPSERAWGIAASLLYLSLPASSMYFFHRRMNNSIWQTTVLGALALVAYAWPDREKGPTTEQPFEHPE